MELKRRRKIQKCSTRVLLLNQFAIEFDFAFGDDFLQVLVFGIFRKNYSHLLVSLLDSAKITIVEVCF